MEQEHTLEGINRDALVIPRALATRLAASGTFEIVLFAEQDNAAGSIRVTAVTLSFPLGGCFLRRVVTWPGVHGTPKRYSGFFTTVTFPPLPLPDDDAAVYVNVTGKVASGSVVLGVLYGDLLARFGDLGTWGPEWAAVPTAGSQKELQRTELSFDGFPEMARLFTTAQDSSGTVHSNITRAEAANVPRAALTQQIAGAGGGELKATVFLWGTQDEAGHPDGLSIHEAGLLYAPEKCFTASLEEGQGIPALLGMPLDRTLEYCSDKWKCDSMGVVNQMEFEGKSKCEAACISQPLSVRGVCYKPFIAEGVCASAAACVCTDQGVASCVTGAGVANPPDGTCSCRSGDECVRNEVDKTFPFRFEGLPAPAGDVTLYVSANLPWPFASDKYLRVRLGEGDHRVLGHVYGSPDCSSERCKDSFILHDPALPVLDAIIIPLAEARTFLSDGALDFSVELDASRPDIQCAVHPEHERCFPDLNDGQVAQRLYPSVEVTTLALAIDGTVTSFDVVSAAAASITAGTHIIVDTEIMTVTAVATNTLTVERGAQATDAAAHPVGTCACDSYAPACVASATSAACTGAEGLWSNMHVRRVNSVLVPGLHNEGRYRLRSLTLSYAVI